MLHWLSGSSGRLAFCIGVAAVAVLGSGYFWGVFINIWWASWWLFPLHVAVTLLLLWVSLVLIVRRLHDLGQSGWWATLIMLPGLAPLFVLPLALFRGMSRAPATVSRPDSSFEGVGTATSS